MADREQLARLKLGPAVWNAWKARQPSDFVADISYAFLSEIALAHYDLAKVDLNHAFLRRCSLLQANLREANLDHTSAFDCSFTQADLSDVAALRQAITERQPANTR